MNDEFQKSVTDWYKELPPDIQQTLTDVAFIRDTTNALAAQHTLTAPQARQLEHEILHS